MYGCDNSEAARGYVVGMPHEYRSQTMRSLRQSCSRCHNAPEALPTRVTGTVLLHMRVRASLSAAGERAILLYLAP
jgi:hypothetical protein